MGPQHAVQIPIPFVTLVEDRAPVWRCDYCKHAGPAADFKTPVGTLCPKGPHPSGRDEDVFPDRHYCCTACGKRGEQHEFFGNDIDPDPIGERWEPECPACGMTDLAKLVQIQ